MSNIPKCLYDYRDALKAVSELETLRNSLADQPRLQTETQFLDDQIDDLYRQLDDLEPVIDRTLHLLTVDYHNLRAQIFSSLYFKCAYSWDEVADFCSIESGDTVRMAVYRAFKRLSNNTE